MRLIDLHPKWEMHGEYRHLSFDCPKCLKGDLFDRIEIPTGDHPRAWNVTGEDFETLSVTPSIWYNRGNANPSHCDVHFFITNGEIVFA